MRVRYREQTFVEIAKAENEMYLKVAEQFAIEGETEMCSTVLGWAAKALGDKAQLTKRAMKRTSR